MLYTQKLLRRYMSLNVDIETIATQLTLKSCEVEEIVKRELPDGVVIGKVLSVNEHENADKLVVCQVDCGNKGKFQICTGATNVVEGSFVPVAIPGTHLPSIGITIEGRKMRGEESNGMICSKEEVGIIDDIGMHAIWTLQSDHKRTDEGYHDDVTAGDFDDIKENDCGLSLKEKYPWLETRNIDIENKTITHRPDMFGHVGLAFELQAIFPGKIGFNNITALQEKLQPPHIMQLIEHTKESDIEVSVTSPHVRTYSTITLSNITVKPSDFYLKLTALDCDFESKSNRIDFSNIFMYTTGQPVHFFDKNKVTGNITVRQAKNDEAFTDLFGEKHTLTEDDIVIADDEKILALAGIIGSESSGVDDNTSEIIIEIANFDPITVRKTATRLGLRTEAEIRYEKSINPLYTLGCVELFIDELDYYANSLGGGHNEGITHWIDDDSEIHVTEYVDADWEYIYELMYGSIEEDGKKKEEILADFEEKATDILTALGCKLSGENISIPVWRAPEDITTNEDLSEEIVRIIGYDNIVEKSLNFQGSYKKLSGLIIDRRRIEKYFLQDAQANQVETYPWLDDSRITHTDLSTENLLSCKNPLNPEKKHLRHTIIWSLLEAIQKNAAFYDELVIFDQGQVWNKERDTREHTVIGFAYHKKEVDDLHHPIRYAKTHIEEILEICDAKGKLTYESTENNLFHPKQQASIHLNGTTIGSIQTVHPLLLEKVKIDQESTVVLVEIDYTMLQKHVHPSNSTHQKYESLSDQIVWRDLNFVLDDDQPFGIITDALLSCKEITDIEIFDLYQGKNLPKGKKSCAVRIKIPASKQVKTNNDGNMTTETINAIMDKAIATVEETGATLRSK